MEVNNFKLEVKVAFALFDSLNSLLQLIKELWINVFEVVFDGFPAFCGHFWRRVVHKVLRQGEDGIRCAIALDEARNAELQEMLAGSA